MDIQNLVYYGSIVKVVNSRVHNECKVGDIGVVTVDQCGFAGYDRIWVLFPGYGAGYSGTVFSKDILSGEDIEFATQKESAEFLEKYKEEHDPLAIFEERSTMSRLACFLGKDESRNGYQYVITGGKDVFMKIHI